MQNRNRLTDIENTFVIAKEEGGGSELGWEFGVSKGKLLHVEWISNEVLPYSTGNHIQPLGIDPDGSENEKKNVHIYMYV